MGFALYAMEMMPKFSGKGGLLINISAERRRGKLCEVSAVAP